MTSCHSHAIVKNTTTSTEEAMPNRSGSSAAILMATKQPSETSTRRFLILSS